MVVAHFHIVGVVVITPDKADTVLVVDPYAVPSFPVTFKRFKAVARRKSEVVQNLGRIHRAPTMERFTQLSGKNRTRILAITLGSVFSDQNQNSGYLRLLGMLLNSK